MAAETLKHKPNTFVRTRLPFKPRKSSRATRRWPEIKEIQEYLKKLKELEVGEEGNVLFQVKKQLENTAKICRGLEYGSGNRSLKFLNDLVSMWACNISWI